MDIAVPYARIPGVNMKKSEVSMFKSGLVEYNLISHNPKTKVKFSIRLSVSQMGNIFSPILGEFPYFCAAV